MSPLYASSSALGRARRGRETVIRVNDIRPI